MKRMSKKEKKLLKQNNNNNQQKYEGKYDLPREYQGKNTTLPPLYLYLSWSEENHKSYPEKVRKVVFTVMMIVSKKDGIPRHPESRLCKLPKEILYAIISFYTDFIVYTERKKLGLRDYEQTFEIWTEM